MPENSTNDQPAGGCLLALNRFCLMISIICSIIMVIDCKSFSIAMAMIIRDERHAYGFYNGYLMTVFVIKIFGMVFTINMVIALLSGLYDWYYFKKKNNTYFRYLIYTIGCIATPFAANQVNSELNGIFYATNKTVGTGILKKTNPPLAVRPPGVAESSPDLTGPGVPSLPGSGFQEYRPLVPIAQRGPQILNSFQQSQIPGESHELAFDSKGQIYASITNNIIYKIEPDGTPLEYFKVFVSDVHMALHHSGLIFLSGAFVEEGSICYVTPDKSLKTVVKGLKKPQGLAFDSSGILFVANSGMNCITKISRDGSRITFASLIRNPCGLAFDKQGDLYVSSTDWNQILKISPNGTIKIFAEGLSRPKGIAFDKNGDLFVANSGNDTILRIGKDGKSEVFARGVKNIADMSQAADALKPVNDRKSNLPWVLKPAVAMVSDWIDQPNSLAFANNGDLYVSQLSSHSVIRIDSSRECRLVNRFRRSSGILFDQDNRLVVAHDGAGPTRGNMISKTDSTGHLQMFLHGGLNGPGQMAFDSNDNLYVINSSDQMVVKITPGKEFFIQFPGFGHLGGIAIDPWDSVYLSAMHENRIIKRLANDQISSITTGEFQGLSKLAVSPGGEIYFIYDSGRGLGKLNLTGTVEMVLSNNPENTLSHLTINRANQVFFSSHLKDGVKMIYPNLDFKTISDATSVHGLLFDRRDNLYFTTINGWIKQIPINSVNP